MEKRLTITEIAKSLGVTPRTIMRWEKAGRVKKPKRDWRGWRFYYKEDLEEMRRFYESIYEYDEFEKSVSNTNKNGLLIALALTSILASSVLCDLLYAEPANFAKGPIAPGIKETDTRVDIILDELPVVNEPQTPITEAVNYTLGPDDVISIEVRRHPEFNGEFTVNSKGKIEYKYIGDIAVNGLTKAELQERLGEILSEYIIKPEISIQIVAYLSKVFYVVGEVGRPGKFYMKGDTITVREALVQSGLPTYSASMRRSRLITPANTNKNNYVKLDVFKLIYEGDLRENKVMRPGDVLYVPATLLAKVIRVISPVTDTVRDAAGAAASSGTIAAAAAL